MATIIPDAFVIYNIVRDQTADVHCRSLAKITPAKVTPALA
jgi:hypothetical protein